MSPYGGSRQAEKSIVSLHVIIFASILIQTWRDSLYHRIVLYAAQARIATT